MVTIMIMNIHHVCVDSMADIMVSTITTLITPTSIGIIMTHIIMACQFIIPTHGGTDPTDTLTGDGDGTIRTITTMAGDTTTIGDGEILTIPATAGDITTDTGTVTATDTGMDTMTECMVTTITTTTATITIQATTPTTAPAAAALAADQIPDRKPVATATSLRFLLPVLVPASKTISLLKI